MILRHLQRQQHAISLGINMAPMIDITFQLITFFMLASHFASAEKVEMKLPRPNHSQAVDHKFKDRIIINMTYAGPDREAGLTFGPLPVASMAELGDRLAEAAAVNPGVQVILRADRRLTYGDVRQVMELVAAHRPTRLQVVTELG